MGLESRGMPLYRDSSRSDVRSLEKNYNFRFLSLEFRSRRYSRSAAMRMYELRSRPAAMVFGRRKYSHGGNVSFPGWEQFIPRVGMSRGACSLLNAMTSFKHSRLVSMI